MDSVDVDGPPTGYFYRHTDNEPYALVKSCSPLYVETVNGQRILDATGGAAVPAIGHRNARVKKAIISQLDEIEYCHPSLFQNNSCTATCGPSGGVDRWGIDTSMFHGIRQVEET